MERDYKYEFRSTYPYIVCSNKVLTDAYEHSKDIHGGVMLDLMMDYILSNGLQDDLRL